MAIRLEPKRGNEVRDYRHDWTPFLGTDTIATQTTTANGVTVNSSAVETGSKSVIFWLSAGVNGVPGFVTQTVVTTGGRTETELFVIDILAEEVISLAQAKEYLRVF